MSQSAGRRYRRANVSRYHNVEPIDSLERRVLLAGVSPVVQSILRAVPSTAETSASSVSYLVTFSAGVTGVDASDFRAIASGGAADAGPIVVTPASSSTYTVTIDGIHGSGSLSLDLVDDDSIRDAGLNPLGGAGTGNGSIAGPSYLIRQTFPTVVSINRAGGAASSTSATNVDFTVTFGKSVSGVAASNFGVVAGAGVQASGGISVTAVDGATYTVHVGGISGNGSLGVNLVNPGGIHDAAGNPLAGSSGALAFQPQATVGTGAQPGSVQLADVNSDGVTDLIVGNTAGNSVGVMLGSVGGSFGALTTYAASAPDSMVVIDVNGDGRPDVVTVGSDHTVSFLRGNGDGTFAAASTLYAGFAVNSVAAADFNGDGRVDLVFGRGAVQGQSAVSVLLNAGGGQFSQPQYIPTGASPLAVTTADVNNDGKLDVIAADFADATAGVLPGNGDGSFKPAMTFGVELSPISIVAADVNGDGNIDLVAADFNASRLSVLLGNGNGIFRDQLTLATGVYPAAVEVADVNGDGKPDLLVADEADNALGVFRATATEPSPRCRRSPRVRSPSPSRSAMPMATGGAMWLWPTGYPTPSVFSLPRRPGCSWDRVIKSAAAVVILSRALRALIHSPSRATPTAPTSTGPWAPSPAKS